MNASVGQSPSFGSRSDLGAATSHPDAPVRHSYPLAITDAGLGTALSLALQTLPYALDRFVVLLEQLTQQAGEYFSTRKPGIEPVAVPGS